MRQWQGCLGANPITSIDENTGYFAGYLGIDMAAEAEVTISRRYEKQKPTDTRHVVLKNLTLGIEIQTLRQMMMAGLLGNIGPKFTDAVIKTQDPMQK